MSGGPHDNSGKPRSFSRRAPAIAASGCEARPRTSVWMAPGGATVSGLSSSTYSPSVARMPMLLARENPRLPPDSITVTPGHFARTCAAVPSGDWLSTTVIVVGNGCV